MQGSHALLQPPPGLEHPAPPPELAACSRLLTTHGAPANSFPSHAQQSPVSTALAGTHNLVGSDPRTGTGPFPKPRALVLPMVNLRQPKSDRLGRTDTVDSDLMHHQFRLSLIQWNPSLARRNPTNIVSAACGKFHAVILQEASDHVPHISDQFRAYTDNTDLAILLNKDTFEPDPMVLTLRPTPRAKVLGAWSYSLFEASLRRPSLWFTDCYLLLSTHSQRRG